MKIKARLKGENEYLVIDVPKKYQTRELIPYFIKKTLIEAVAQKDFEFELVKE